MTARTDATEATRTLTTDVLIVGGGPAGALLGCLLARRGIDVVVVEKQDTLDREFRGETIAAPSVVTLERLGFGPALRGHGYLETSGVAMRMEGHDVFEVDYGRFEVGVLPIDIPQPALIGIFHEAADALPNHTYLSGATFTSLVEKGGQVHGAVVRHRDRSRTLVDARLVVGADGRFSKVRKAAGLPARVTPMERDFLWIRLPRPADWGDRADLVVRDDRHLVILPTFPDLLRIGHNLPKRALGELRAEGLPRFRDSVAEIDPRLRPLLEEHLTSWDDTGFLEIFTTEVDRWARDGLVLIGDASHTCTPILGQGVNLAIQDAVCLVPVVARSLMDNQGALPAVDFDAFVAARKRHKTFVTRYQRLQEAALAQRTPWRVALRRARFRLLDALPLKYRVFGKVINAPHPIDPEDLRLAREATTASPVDPSTVA
ncbi:FAD-dependent monooxygenase [Kitasatospora sp. NPDC057015]|uniref:FAD-dependent monooxygenase n=1 Tax=Kitasatospora sp. NPDC057015 TaxID=3346001 RepID=UPI0036379EAC